MYQQTYAMSFAFRTAAAVPEVHDMVLMCHMHDNFVAPVLFLQAGPT